MLSRSALFEQEGVNGQRLDAGSFFAASGNDVVMAQTGKEFEEAIVGCLVVEEA